MGVARYYERNYGYSQTDGLSRKGIGICHSVRIFFN